MEKQENAVNITYSAEEQKELNAIRTLVTGLGMSCILVWDKMVPGILIGLAGLAGVAGAYPMYQRVIRKERARVADEIMQLSEAE